ncbi:hypothetical protein Ahy_A05g023355 [Arachis hypogaea]|uniref:CCHC-type domain-containing protein n=1 Tax=Arachis hypogaea TaxID=3818 RepID=A0A445D3D4_ARAHY|nr:hypothetical protein Ahy_A05g023355 [Arachis hypogaea]
MEENMKLFKSNADSIAICEIAELRDYVELFVVHKVEENDVFSVAGSIDVGEDHRMVDKETRDSDDDDNQEVEFDNSDDSDSLNSKYKPSEEEDDSINYLHFIDSEDELDPDVSGFQDVNVMTEKCKAVKKKGVATENFENDEGANNDELDLDHKVGVEGSDSDHEGVRVGILHLKWLGKAFKKNVESNLKVKIKELVAKAQKKWNLTITKAMAMRSKQIALDEIQETFREQYKRIYDYGHELLRENPDSSVRIQCYESIIHPLNGPDLWERIAHHDVMLPPYRRPSHRPVKKRKPAIGEEEQSNHTHLSRKVEKLRCLICGSVGHNKNRCPKPIEDEAQHSKKLSKDKQKKESTKSHPPAIKGGRKIASSRPTPKRSVKRIDASTTQLPSSAQSNSAT